MKKWTKEDCYFNIPSQREIPKVMKKQISIIGERGYEMMI
jgi:hypothetical protein